MVKAKNNEHLKKLIDEVIEGKLKLNDIDVSEIEDFSYVFQSFKFKKDYGDISNWDVSNGKNFESMFFMASNLNYIDFSNWNMKNALTTAGMFYFCGDFNGHGLEHWNLENVINAELMFFCCTSFDNDLSNWNMKNVQNLEKMFYNCKSFRGIGLNKWNICLINKENTSALDFTFYNCYNFDSDLSNWIINQSLSLYNTFYNCHNFKGKGIDKFTIYAKKTPRMKNNIILDSTFANCFNLQIIPNLKISYKKAYLGWNCFSNTYSLRKIDFNKKVYLYCETNFTANVKLHNLNNIEAETNVNIHKMFQLKNFPNLNMIKIKEWIYNSKRKKPKGVKEEILLGFNSIKYQILKTQKIDHYPKAIVEGSEEIFNNKEFFLLKNIFFDKNFLIKYFK